MSVLELDRQQMRVLLKKAYEWKGKVNNPKKNDRMNYYKTLDAIKKFKRHIKAEIEMYVPTYKEVTLMMTWFNRCPPKTRREDFVFTYIGLIYKLHGHELMNGGS